MASRASESMLLRITPEMRLALLDCADDEVRPVAQIIREAINKYLKTHRGA